MDVMWRAGNSLNDLNIKFTIMYAVMFDFKLRGKVMRFWKTKGGARVKSFHVRAAIGDVLIW